MRLGIALAVVVVLGVVATLAVQRLDEAERYRTLIDSGEQALAAGNTYAAIETFSGAIALRADSWTAYLRRGDAYRAQRRVEDAARDYRDAARLQPGAREPLLALAVLHDGRGDPGEAAEWYARAAAIDRQSPTLLYHLALTRYRSGQAAAAVEPLRQAIALTPDFDEALYLLGLVLRDTQDPSGAIDVLERAVRLNPDLAAAREELADLYRLHQRPSDEMAQLTVLATLDPRTGREAAIALAQARRGEFDLAESTLTAAAAGAPDDSAIALARGRIRILRAEAAPDAARRARWAADAADALEKALGGTARRAEGMALYGRALYLGGHIEDAANILRGAVATIPFSRDALLYLADAVEAMGDHADARLWLTRYDILEGDTASPDVRRQRARRLGRLALTEGDFPAALAQLTPLLAPLPDDAELRGWVAEARWHTGDADGARATLAEAFALAPNDARLRRLRQLIR